MRKILGCGCLALVLLVAGVSALIITDPRGRQLVDYSYATVVAFLAIAKADAARSEYFFETSATVMEVEMAEENSRGDSGLITLSYLDETGMVQTKTARVYLSTRSLAQYSEGDEVTIEVCKQDPTIVKVPRLKIVDTSRCLAVSKADDAPIEVVQ